MFDDHYNEWREKRIKTILNYYTPEFFKDKTLLELGAGYCDIGAEFAKLGSIVTCVEGRQEHLEVAKERYSDLNIVFKQLDLDKEVLLNNYDIVLHMGLLYHLRHPESSIRNICQIGKHIVLESEILDSSSPYISIPVKEGGYDQAMNGWGCRPTKNFVEYRLIECGVKFEMLQSDSANSHFHVYDWRELDNGKWQDGQRRMWFISKVD